MKIRICALFLQILSIGMVINPCVMALDDVNFYNSDLDSVCFMNILSMSFLVGEYYDGLFHIPEQFIAEIPLDSLVDLFFSLISSLIIIVVGLTDSGCGSEIFSYLRNYSFFNFFNLLLCEFTSGVGGFSPWII